MADLMPTNRKIALASMAEALRLTEEGDRHLATKSFDAAGASWAQAHDELERCIKLQPDLLPTWLGYMEIA